MSHNPVKAARHLDPLPSKVILQHLFTKSDPNRTAFPKQLPTLFPGVPVLHCSNLLQVPSLLRLDLT